MQRGPQPTQDTTLKTTKQKETLKIGRAAAPGEHYVFCEDGLLTGLTHVGNFVSVLIGARALPGAPAEGSADVCVTRSSAGVNTNFWLRRVALHHRSKCPAASG